MSSALSLRSILDANKLTGPNFVDWLQNLRIVLKSEKMGYVLKSPLPKAPDNDVTYQEHQEYHKWINEANVAKCIMLASMNPELQKQHEHMDAYTILVHLQDLYDVEGRTSRYEISKELFYSKMAERTSVNEHVLKMINLIESLGQLDFGLLIGEGSTSKKRKRTFPKKKKKIGESKPTPAKANVDPKSNVV
ncbi:uncharacterized protein LOC141660826 [Apium graveolens]|uniref:uncharacterized protein LOC141660826 n=1 Tax=Apium graveolens TaxID=4045 RepID=UPI003D7AB34B